MISSKPVSYTHLDVYKRQTDSDLNTVIINADKDLIKRAVSNLIQNSINPVSYTHLDVYKRQTPLFPASFVVIINRFLLRMYIA